MDYDINTVEDLIIWIQEAMMNDPESFAHNTLGEIIDEGITMRLVNPSLAFIVPHADKLLAE